MNIATLFILTCYIASTFAGWYNCEPCRCHQTPYNVIAQCIITNSPAERTLDVAPKGLNEDIQELQMRGHHINALHENNFEQYKKLEILDLSQNRIIEVKNHAFKNLINLRELILSCNELITLPTNIFRDTPSITSVYLNNNKFTTLQKDLFSNLPHLEDVHIQNNSLLTIQENCFVNVPLLARINLSRNQLTYISSKTFPNLDNIKTLNLAHNPWNCDIHLCEIVSITVIQSWDKLSSPVCHSPENKFGKSWRHVLDNHTPTITHVVSNSPTGQNVTLKCDICSKSGITWIYNHQNIIENVVNVTDKHSITSLLTLNGVSDNNNGIYSCRVEDCKSCEEDAISLHVNQNSLEILRQLKNSKVAGVKVRKSIEEIVTTTKAHEYTSTPTSTTLQTTEIITTKVTEHTVTAAKYIDRSEADIIGKNSQEYLILYVFTPFLIIITMLIATLIAFSYRRKYKFMKKKYVEKQNRSEPESEPLSHEKSNPPTPPSTHKYIQTKMITNEEPLINSNHSNETNQNGRYKTTCGNNNYARIHSYMQDTANTTHSEYNSTIGSSSEGYRTNTSSEIFRHIMLTRNDSGYGSNDKPEYFILNRATSYYTDETPD